MTHLIAIDPGRCKCGLVLVDRDQACVVEGIVLPRQEVDVQIETWIATVHGVERILLGDGTSSGASVSSGVVGTLPVLGSTTTTAGGVAGALAGSVGTDGSLSITAGGAGTNATAQHVSELSIFN